MKKVIDCFTFYNELEILELKLEELYDVVDLFILVEAEKTHKGENKRFIF
jgi:beta-1,4-mannosyl-glycoprotein beta-1,4-N-acetylglucosaminyltransferase